MAQFSHADFGGMSQWSPGMTMVGDMFNNDLKSKLDFICTELASHIAEASSELVNDDRPDAAEVSYRSAGAQRPMVARRSRNSEFRGCAERPALRRLSETKRLAIQDGRQIVVYDTGDHKIFAVAQAQSRDQTLTFTSQTGLVRVSELPKLDLQPEIARFPPPYATSTVAGKTHREK